MFTQIVRLVIVLAGLLVNKGGQTCIDVVGDIQQARDEIISPDRTVIVPRLNFTCNGRITNIRVRVETRTGTNFPSIQVWRLTPTPELYSLVDQVQIQSSHINNQLANQEAIISLTGNNRIQFLSGDVIGFYNPPNSRYVFEDIETPGYVYYVFVGSSASSLNLLDTSLTPDLRHPLIQFTLDIQCNNLTTPSNGVITSCSSVSIGVGYEGDTCSYTCNTGYELTGSDTRTCQSNGNWSGSNDVCRRVMCPVLGTPANGMITCSDDQPANPDETCTATCNTGYKLENDDSTRMCMSDGMWSGTEAICTRVTCAPLANPTNGAINCTLGDDRIHSYEDICTATCNAGYVLSDDEMRTCQSSSTWSGTEAMCSRVMCTMPTNPMNGMISCQLGDDGVLSYEDICTTTCNSGYEIQDGDAMRTCGSDRSFNGTDATCSRVTCTMLTAPTNGMITCSGGDNVPTVGDTCSYTCNTGYVLSGNSMRTCGSGGNWSGTEPTCIGTCPVLTDPTNGMVTCSLGDDGVATAGETCSYICDNGFVRLSGDATRTCGSDRSWSGSAAVCGTVPTVTIVSNPAGTLVSGSTNTFDYPILSSVTLTCMVTSSDGSTITVTNYQWNTGGCYTHPDHDSGDPTCFPTGQTTQSVTGNDLTAEDAGTITCTVTIGGVDYTSGPLTLRISGIAMTGVLVGNTDIVTGNLLTDYSIIRDTDNGLVARCVSGLGPTSSDDNTALGIWYFNGAPIPYGLCEEPVVNLIQSRIAGLMNFVGVVNLWQCIPSLTPAAEGVYTCVILDSSMMNQTTRLGVYFSGRTAPMIDPPPPSNVTVAVGDSLTLSCTSRGSPPDTFTWRKDSDPIVQSTSIATVTHDSTTAVFRANYSIDSLTLDDIGTYTCTVTNPIGSDSETIDVTVIVPVPPTVTISPSGPIQGAMVGSPQMIYCIVNTSTVLDVNLVMFAWFSPEGEAITNDDSRVTINPTTSSGNNYTSSIQFTYLMEGDEGTYTCDVTTFGMTGSASVVLEPLNVPTPSVTVTAPNPTNQSVGGPLTLRCDVTAVRGITSRVDIIWSSGGRELNRTNDTPPTILDSSLEYTDTYTISLLSTDDEGREYNCTVVINASPVVTASNSVTLDVMVPTPSVTVTAPNTQIVGDPLLLTCSVTAVRGITSRVDIVWRRGDLMLMMTNNISITMMDSSLVYTDTYTIPQLSTDDENRDYECNVMINASPVVMANGGITLNVTVPTPNVTISSLSGSLQGAMVGSPQMIQCTVSTVSGVESSSVIISWMGPGGNPVTNDSRVTINPTTSSGNTYNSILQAAYLMEGDEGTYMCNVMILETSGSGSAELGELIVPTPNVTVTAPNTQTVGDSLTLTCNVTAVRGITSSVDIIWSSDSDMLETMEGVSVSSTIDNSVVYTDTYMVIEVSTDDEDRDYQCQVVVNTTPPVMATGSVTLDVMVPQPSVVTSQMSDGSFSGLNFGLTCRVTVVSGVQSNLVMVSWTGGSSLSSSPRVTISDQTNDGLVYIRTVTFSPLLNDDEEQYTCSVSVTGFDEASNSDSIMVMVNAPTVTATLTPTAISGDEGGQSIELNCTASVEPDVVLQSYQFIWMKNGSPVDLSISRINVIDETMSSSYGIDAMDTNATLDNGMYTCQVTLTIAGVDGFLSTSNSATVGLRAMVPPFPPILREVTTTPYSVNISWVVPTIVFDQETYTVQYGTDMTMLQSTSELIQGSSNRNVTNGNFFVNITGLTPFTRYYYVITATNTVGSTSTAIMNFTTDETAPSIAPMEFMSTTTTSDSITFQWTLLTDGQANGNVRWYIITCNETFMVNVTGTTMMGTVAGLSPFTDYSCTIFATTVADGPISNPVVERTAEGVPDPPMINNITDISSSVVRVTWTRPDVLNGILISYTITYVTDGPPTDMIVDYNQQETQFYDIMGLDPYQLVTVTLRATTGGGTSDRSNELSGRSSEAAPGIVVHTTTSTSNTAVIVMWNPPDQPNGIITGYEVMYSVYESTTAPMMSERLNGSVESFLIENLEPGTPYQARVVAYTIAGRGIENKFEPFFSQELAASKAPETVDFKPLSPTSVNVTWTPLTLFEAQGFPLYTVSLTLSSSRKRQSPDAILTSNSFAVFENLASGRQYSAVVGVITGNSSGTPNPPVTSDPITVMPESGGGGSSDSSSIGPIIGGAAGGVSVAIIVIVVVVILVCRSRSLSQSLPIAKRASWMEASTDKRMTFSRATGSFSKKNEASLIASTSDNDFLAKEHSTFQMDTLAARQTSIKKAASSSAPVSLKDFAGHVADMHKNKNHGFEIEYASISAEPVAPGEAAKLPVNRTKNRYANIFAYDESRVKLQSKTEDGSDYINSSFIDGFSKSNAYIAAQGPMPDTVKDFWQMVWEQKTPTIVMLTRTMEGNKPKCEKYWPNNVGDTINPKPSLTVKLTQLQLFADYEIRTLQVQATSDPNSVPLELNHFLFTGWPDHGVPQFATGLISFIRRVRQSHPKDGPPMLVHCSAGVGRTGTFITLDIMLERIPQTHDVNVYECVQTIRVQRVLMVQTLDQYIFIHDALDEFITCGETSFSVQNIRVKVNRLSKEVPGTGKTGFQDQFELLQKVSRQLSGEDCSDALSEHNRDKNFSNKAIPFNLYRVFMSATTMPGSDYINASFIDGYKKRNAYIATQCPLVGTVDTFWRMVWEYNSAVIVTLCSVEQDKQDFLQYWPTGETDYGKIKVKLTSEANPNGYFSRKFTIFGKEGTKEKEHHVTMLHYTNWPATGIAADTKSLLSLIKEVLEIQRGTGNKAITVMCSDGCARSGAFINISYALERLKVEGIVDIFNAVKSSRIRRAELVGNVEQFKYCHVVVSEFLDEFDQYSNFK
ncbi:receptor-type tyrosine-protein phosphatase delta-like isoform X2 [Dysidea avara]|uniref:receptor-type tyrosine-protein phosphatase delta-like isoform X2 n=1 Tax=Dysidea avara TaxID=196820 RepID=UPI0033255F20